MKKELSEIINKFQDGKAALLIQLKIMVAAKNDKYRENCESLKEREAWEIMHKADRRISSWYFDEMQKLNKEYDDTFVSA